MDRIAFIALRKQYSLTQAQFGEMLTPKVSRQAIIKWEKGLHPLPVDIEARLLAADLAAPAMKKDASKHITVASHPALYHPIGRGNHARRLSHPKWWYGVGTPFRALCSEEEWKAIDGGASVSDLATYVPPTVEQARELMVSRGISLKDADRYLAFMGHITLPPTRAAQYNAALAEWNATHDDPREKGWGPFEEANPQWCDATPRHVSTPEELADAAAKIEALNASFANLNPKPDESK